MSLWFSASAVSGQYRALWGLSAAEAGWVSPALLLRICDVRGGGAVVLHG
jgi:hypothetical protein